jgi:Trypsin-like peptidase domain
MISLRSSACPGHFNREKVTVPDLQSLEPFSVEELLQELKQRQASPSQRGDAPSALQAFETGTIVQVLREKQKIIYGTDDRRDWYQLNAQQRDDADCVVALLNDSSLVDNGDGTSTLQTENYGTSQNLCAREPFRNQPVSAFCSGFLVAPDVIATAGHCTDESNVTTVRFVFGFRMNDATTAQVRIKNDEIYSGVRIIGRQEIATGADWALVKLDRPVVNHKIVAVRTTGKIPDDQAVHVIGHPCGLPLKYADGAIVRSNNSAEFFVANLDSYGGNSGSPVFNSMTRQVEGILVRGETDFVASGNCQVSLICPSTGCRGEDCTRTTEFVDLL